MPPYHCELNPIELTWTDFEQFFMIRQLQRDGIEKNVMCSWAFVKYMAIFELPTFLNFVFTKSEQELLLKLRNAVDEASECRKQFTGSISIIKMVMHQKQDLIIIEKYPYALPNNPTL
nr:unnamed protein product [Callosobruchus chinensis]